MQQNAQPEDLEPQGMQQNAQPQGIQRNVRPQSMQPTVQGMPQRARLQGIQRSARPQTMQQNLRQHGMKQSGNDIQNISRQGIEQNVPLRGMRPGMPPRGMQRNTQPLGLQRNVRPQGFQQNMRPQNMLHKVRPEGGSPFKGGQKFESQQTKQRPGSDWQEALAAFEQCAAQGIPMELPDIDAIEDVKKRSGSTGSSRDQNSKQVPSLICLNMNKNTPTAQHSDSKNYEESMAVKKNSEGGMTSSQIKKSILQEQRELIEQMSKDEMAKGDMLKGEVIKGEKQMTSAKTETKADLSQLNIRFVDNKRDQAAVQSGDSKKDTSSSKTDSPPTSGADESKAKDSSPTTDSKATGKSDTPRPTASKGLLPTPEMRSQQPVSASEGSMKGRVVKRNRRPEVS